MPLVSLLVASVLSVYPPVSGCPYGTGLSEADARGGRGRTLAAASDRTLAASAAPERPQASRRDVTTARACAGQGDVAASGAQALQDRREEPSSRAQAGQGGVAASGDAHALQDRREEPSPRAQAGQGGVGDAPSPPKQREEPSPRGRAVTLYQQGRERSAAGRNGEAAALFEQALGIDPDHGDARAALGWSRYRLGQYARAAAVFGELARRDPARADAWTGLGLARLQLGEHAASEESLAKARTLAPGDPEPLKALALLSRRSGRPAEALALLRQALEISPGDEEAREALAGVRAQLGLVTDRRLGTAPPPPSGGAPGGTPRPRMTVRAGARYFEALAGEVWRPFLVKGVNLGVAVPGKFPAEFPESEQIYRDWLAKMREMNANSVRVYTLLPPVFYRALAEENRAHPEALLRLVQGVWAELPPGNDFAAPAWNAEYAAEIRRVVDALHGNIEVAPRPGHASGLYDADVSAWLLGYILGREWEPYAVEAYDRAAAAGVAASPGAGAPSASGSAPAGAQGAAAAGGVGAQGAAGAVGAGSARVGAQGAAGAVGAGSARVVGSGTSGATALPTSISGSAGRSGGASRYEGRYVRVAAGTPTECWIASTLEIAAAHEAEMYGESVPVSFTNWPTLDPLFHPTEATRKEEDFILEGLGRGRPADDEPIYDNDAVSLDAGAMRPTAELPAGLFASYHAYPYYPDFMILDPGYLAGTDSEGPNAYAGYLRDLVRHHAGQPVLVAEVGVPTSRGSAHSQPQGWRHGGHDEAAQAAIDARLMRTVREAGCAGGIVFSWLDEWFKRNWLVADLETPAERNPFWLNALDPEQNFGILAAVPGPAPAASAATLPSARTPAAEEQEPRSSAGAAREQPLAAGIVLDGWTVDWEGIAPVYAPRRGKIRALYAACDEGYLYLRLDVARAGASAPVPGPLYWIGIDTYERALGDRGLPGLTGRLRIPSGLEFAIRLGGSDPRILVDASYDIGSHRNKGPYASVANTSGRFVSMKVEIRMERLGRDGTVFPAEHADLSPLRRGTTRLESAAYDSLADYYEDAGAGVFEIRIPWGLLNVTDPSSRRVVHQSAVHLPPIDTRTTDGFVFYVAAVEAGASRPDDQRPRVGERPRLFSWQTWEAPRFHIRPKRVYEALKETFGALDVRGASE